jgi:two-component system cell cycle response regulator DivK
MFQGRGVAEHRAFDEERAAHVLTAMASLPDHGSSPPRAYSSGTLRRPRALLIDDDTDLLEMLAWCIRAGGWLVEGVGNGHEGLVAASLLEPDVILMDLNLPVIDGFEAIRRLKRDEDTKHIPILACTGVGVASAEKDARAAGCDGFVTKPCEPEVIRALLEALVTGRRGSLA